jgi:hypothetical protein
MLIKHIRKGSGVIVGDLLFQLCNVEKRPEGELRASFDVEGLYGLALSVGGEFKFTTRGKEELEDCKLIVREIGPTYVELGLEAPGSVKISGWKGTK